MYTGISFSALNRRIVLLVSGFARQHCIANWLKINIAPLFNYSFFQSGGEGILFITFDEGFSTDIAHGGGQVATVVVGPHVLPAHKDGTFWQHQNLLRTVAIALGLSKYPGMASNGCSMYPMF